MCWMRRKDAPPELADRRTMLTCKIAELRKEDKIAEGAIKRIQRTRESNRIDRENQEHHTNHNRRRNRSRHADRRYNGLHQEKIRTKIQNHCLQRL